MSPKLAQTIYQLSTVVAGILGVALIWGGIDSGTADSINQIIAGIAALIPGAGTAVATKRVSEQRKDGTLDKLSPAEQVAKGVGEALAAKKTVEEQFGQIKDVVSGAIEVIPGFGPLASAALDNVHIDA